MSAPANFRDLVIAERLGQGRRSEWVKNVNQVTTTGLWFDISGSSGNPKAKQWFDASPLVAQQVKQSTDGGIYHGAPVSPATKYLRSLRLGCASATPLPLELILCDYLLYYPSVDDGEVAAQEMDNALTLPRYTDGEGVEMMAVTISARTGGQTFSVSYTNSAGVAGRTSGTVTQNAGAAPGTITTASTATSSGGNPFIPLQAGDTGVRSVESITMNGPDTGFFALVLVRPLCSSIIRGLDAPYEKDLLVYAGELPRIYDDAFLSALVRPNGSLSGLAIRGNIQTVWS